MSNYTFANAWILRTSLSRDMGSELTVSITNISKSIKNVMKQC